MVFNIYFLAIFNSSQVQGNIFTIGILFGLSEALGIMFGERVIQLMPDWVGYIFSTSVIVICSIIVKIPGLDQSVVYVVFLIQVLFVGISFNIAYMMQESKTHNPALKAISLELNMSFGNCFTFFCPLVAKAAEPVPTLMFIFLGLSSMLLITKMDSKQKPMNLESSILSILMDDQKSGFKELSSINFDPVKDRVAKWKLQASESSFAKTRGRKYGYEFESS
jgi:hypothetical protein